MPLFNFTTYIFSNQNTKKFMSVLPISLHDTLILKTLLSISNSHTYSIFKNQKTLEASTSLHIIQLSISNKIPSRKSETKQKKRIFALKNKILHLSLVSQYPIHHSTNTIVIDSHYISNTILEKQ